MADSPFKIFTDWLFDKNLNSDIPEKEILLKYNSPISETYLISLFKKSGHLNHFLDKYLNNIGIRYIEKEDLFRFVKKCVIDFNVTKYQLSYSWSKRKDKLFNKLCSKFPLFKVYDIDLLCEMIDMSKDKEKIYSTFGIEKPVKQKIKKSQSKTSKLSLKNFIKDNFIVVEV